MKCKQTSKQKYISFNILGTEFKMIWAGVGIKGGEHRLYACLYCAKLHDSVIYKSFEEEQIFFFGVGK